MGMPVLNPVLQAFTAVPSTLSALAIETGLDVTAAAAEAAARTYAGAGLALTRLVSGVREARVPKKTSEREVGVPPFFLTKHDHFITSLDGSVDLMLGELGCSASPKNGYLPALFYTHGMFMNANFGLFPIDGNGPVPNIDTIRTFLGFFAFLGFPVFYLHLRNCVHVQNRYVRNHSRYVTDPALRPDLRSVPYIVPERSTFETVMRGDIGAAL